MDTKGQVCGFDVWVDTCQIPCKCYFHQYYIATSCVTTSGHKHCLHVYLSYSSHGIYCKNQETSPYHFPFFFTRYWSRQYWDLSSCMATLVEVGRSMIHRSISQRTTRVLSCKCKLQTMVLRHWLWGQRCNCLLLYSTCIARINRSP